MTEDERRGLRIRAAREALGYNQRKLCQLLDIQPNRWNQFEKGSRNPPVDPMMKWADRMGVSLDWVYRGRLDAVPPTLASAIADKYDALTRGNAGTDRATG